MQERPGWLDWVAASISGVFSTGTLGRRLGDITRLGLITSVWPGKESRLYQITRACDPPSPDEGQLVEEAAVTRVQVEANDRPVAILLHGFCSTTTESHFGPLKAWLTDPATGRYGLVLGYECDTVQRRIPELAEELRIQLDRVGLLQGTRQIDLYTHSLGALIARWLLEDPGGPDHAGQHLVRTSVRRLIMAGPPNLGTRMAELGDRLLSVLRRQSSLLRRDAGVTNLRCNHGNGRWCRKWR